VFQVPELAATPGDGPRPLLPAAARLRFRPWTGADADLARSLWGDPEVMRYLHQGAYSEAQIRSRLEGEAANLAAYGFQYWPMFLTGTGEFVGCAGLKPCPYEGSAEAPELELGFHLRPSMWGLGLATEAGAAVARLAFETHGVPRVYAGHHPENHGSGNVLRKLGFVFTRDVFFEPTGLMHPLYVLTTSAFAARNTIRSSDT
jgi:[ribosomal protein S5]-alanine N-acetyltransferase